MAGNPDISLICSKGVYKMMYVITYLFYYLSFLKKSILAKYPLYMLLPIANMAWSHLDLLS